MTDATGTPLDGTATPEPVAVPGNQGAADTVTQDAGKGKGAEPSPAAAPAVDDPFAELETDTRDWLSKREIKDAKAAAKLAHEQSKLLGNAIRIPGKDAKPEDIAAFEEKLGVPKTADDYGFKVPKDLPADLPYDGERAKRFADKAKELRIPKDAANALHDWFTSEVVGDVKTSRTAEDERKLTVAKGETAKLEKLYGPLDGETMRAQMAYADKALAIEPEALAEFQRVGLIGEAKGGQKIVQSAAIASLLARLGMAVYKEDNVLRGTPDRLNNPFAEGKTFNLTAAMKMIKEDRDTALSFITAAGKRPEDFGLKA